MLVLAQDKQLIVKVQIPLCSGNATARSHFAHSLIRQTKTTSHWPTAADGKFKDSKIESPETQTSLHSDVNINNDGDF